MQKMIKEIKLIWNVHLYTGKIQYQSIMTSISLKKRFFNVASCLTKRSAHCKNILNLTQIKQYLSFYACWFSIMNASNTVEAG